MSESNATPEKPLDRYSKEHRWYYKSIDGHIRPDARKLLDKYSHIPAADVDTHILKMRDVLWNQAPYPCVGDFRFLYLNLPKHPSYQAVLSLLSPSRSSSTEAPAPKLLDLGCCVAQELRSLAFAGIPSSNLYGSDLVANFLTTSYELFNDKDTFKGTLVPANIFSDTLFTDVFIGWEEKFTVIHAGLFLHLFNWDQQILVCERIVNMLKRDKGAMFVGEMAGCQGGGYRGSDTKFWVKGQERKQYLHDEGSFERLWKEVAERTGTTGKWKVQAKLRAREKKKSDEGIPWCAFFVGEGVGWITFSVERT